MGFVVSPELECQACLPIIYFEIPTFANVFLLPYRRKKLHIIDNSGRSQVLPRAPVQDRLDCTEKLGTADYSKGDAHLFSEVKGPEPKVQ